MLINPMPFRDLEMINRIILTCVLLHNFLLTKDESILHPVHHFQDAEYRQIMASVDAAKEKALEEANNNRKRKGSALSAKEKRQVIAEVLGKDLSEEKCVLFLGLLLRGFM